MASFLLWLGEIITCLEIIEGCFFVNLKIVTEIFICILETFLYVLWDQI